MRHNKANFYKKKIKEIKMKKIVLYTLSMQLLFLCIAQNSALNADASCSNASLCPLEKYKEKTEPSKNVSAPAETQSSYANPAYIKVPDKGPFPKPLIPSESRSDLYRGTADREDEDDIPLTEDLMREHGVLNRVLLIYEEIIRRIDRNVPFSLRTLEQAVNIIKTFIEEYHEKMEEDYLFPLFEKHKTEVRLVRTLKLQHTRGKEITSKIRNILAGKSELNQPQKRMVRGLLQQFIIMYRPHEARESTVLFPKVRGLMTEKEFKEMGEKFDDLEHKLFGKDGFETTVDKITALEKELGIYNLEQFTPA